VISTTGHVGVKKFNVPFRFLSGMPLDCHSYLVAQGWSGKGSGLRQGAISRPLAIPQKRTLAGIGKDREDAFPFWDQCVHRLPVFKSRDSRQAPLKSFLRRSQVYSS
jgi:hypothetical protein